MKKSVFTILIIFILSPLTIFSQEDSVGSEKKTKIEKTNFKHSLGVAAGFTTGYGLSYRFIPNKFGAQIAFAPYKDDNNSRYSLGLTLILKLVESKRANLFIYQGNHFLFEEKSYQDRVIDGGYYDSWGYYYPNYRTITKTDQTTQINNGVGIGIELKAGQHIGFNIMAGYAGYDSFNTINATGEFALFFNF